MANDNQKKPEEYKYTLEDIARYRPIKLAPEFAESGNRGDLEETIKTVLGNIGVKEEETRDLSLALNAENFIKVYEGKYQKALFSQKLGDLRNLYSDPFKKFYSEENLPEVDKVFDSDETYEDFMKKFAKVVEIVQSKTDNFSKEQKEKAQKDLDELKKIALPLQEFEKRELNKLRQPIEDRALGRLLNALYEEKPKEEKEVA